MCVRIQPFMMKKERENFSWSVIKSVKFKGQSAGPTGPRSTGLLSAFFFFLILFSLNRSIFYVFISTGWANTICTKCIA